MRLLSTLRRWGRQWAHGLARALAWAVRGLINALRRIPRRWYRRAAWTVGVAIVAAVLGYDAIFIYIERQVAPAPALDQVRFLDQGWGAAPNSIDRETFSFTPQGSSLVGLPYDWLVNLERPWKTDRFAAPQYMRAYGFVVPTDDFPTPTVSNPGLLPVGLAPRWDPASGQTVVDMTCATCHTGELDVMRNGQRIGVRIDGGPAMHDLTSTRLGRFPTDLMASLIATYLDPFKFHRFAAKVLQGGDTSAARGQLRAQLGAEIGALVRRARTDGGLHLYPVEEGPGRTDALGRIANTLFGANLDPANYHVADAPVSYPPLWDIWKFDWVQYGASVRQPMARNMGESLGTGARVSLIDKYGRPVPQAERFMISTIVPNLRVIEGTLQKLRPPCWPEDLFGKIDVPLATEGAGLFVQYCQTCHGPHEASPIQKAFDAPLKTPDQPEWVMDALKVDDIGTDPNTALNFVNNHYDLTRTGLTSAQVRAQLELTLRPAYDRQLIKDAAIIKACVNGSAKSLAAQADQAQMQAEGPDAWMSAKEGPIDLSRVSNGEGITYLLAFMRPLAYRQLGLPDSETGTWDGYGQLDTPVVAPQYKARPLAGVWATAPYLHNGSVPNLYELLSPVYEREKVFYLSGREFDPVRVGLVTNSAAKNAFRFDTSIPGNFNTGMEFRAGYQDWHQGDPPAHGIVGPELTPHQRMAIIEYLKVHRDDPNDHSCSVNVPLPPTPPVKDDACSTVEPKQ